MSSHKTSSSKEKPTRLKEAKQAARDRLSAKRRHLRDTAKARYDWTHQYFQGKDTMELGGYGLGGYGCGACTLMSPEVSFTVPFSDKGKIEVQSEFEGDGSGSIRIMRGNPWNAKECDIFMVPFLNIERELHVSKAAATLLPIMGSAITTAQSGYMILLKEGVLWVSDTILWLPHSCFNKIICIFMRYLASKAIKNDKPAVAMGVIIEILDLAAKEGDASQTKKVLFDNIKDLRAHNEMSFYHMFHDIQMERVQQTFYDYSKGQPMTDWEPIPTGT